MTIRDFLKKNWARIGEWISLAVLIYVIFQFYVGRAWCYNLVQPYFDYYANVSYSKVALPNNSNINSSNFDAYIGWFLSKKTCVCAGS